MTRSKQATPKRYGSSSKKWQPAYQAISYFLAKDSNAAGDRITELEAQLKAAKERNDELGEALTERNLTIAELNGENQILHDNCIALHGNWQTAEAELQQAIHKNQRAYQWGQKVLQQLRARGDKIRDLQERQTFINVNYPEIWRLSSRLTMNTPMIPTTFMQQELNSIMEIADDSDATVTDNE